MTCLWDWRLVYCIRQRGAMRCSLCEYRHCESPGVWNGHVWFSRFIICTKLTNLTTPIKTLENQKSR